MKKITLILAILLVVLISQFSYAKLTQNSVKYSVKTTLDPDPPNSIRTLINGEWYLIILDSNGNPIEIIRVPVRE